MMRMTLAIAVTASLTGPAYAVPDTAPSPSEATAAPVVEPVPDDGDKASLLASLARSRTYLAGLHKPTLTLLGQPILLTRFQQSAARFEELVQTAWGTPAFDRAMREEFEWVSAPGTDGKGAVRFTGYHLPLLDARARPDATHRFPLYAPPADIVAAPLGAFKPQLAGTTVLGRVKNGLLVPYFSRTEIDDGHALAGRGLEVAWVSDELARFSLMVQGSGILRYEDGHTVNVNYAGQNGHAYVGLGKALVADGRIPMDQLSMPAIQAYFVKYPEQMHAYLGRNPSYVFFKLAQDGPFGVDGISLTAGRSIATDKRLFPSGAIAYIQYPRARLGPKGDIVGWEQGARFVLDQDTGGAITGPGRVDIFYGGGEEAARRAGTLNGLGRSTILLLRAGQETSVTKSSP